MVLQASFMSSFKPPLSIAILGIGARIRWTMATAPRRQETSLKNLKKPKEFKRENSQFSKVILTAAFKPEFFLRRT
jgi:hypothetical protein